MTDRKVVVKDRSGRGGKTRRRDRLQPHTSIVPAGSEELHPRTKNKFLRELCDAARRLGASAGVVWRLRTQCGDAISGDVLPLERIIERFKVLRDIENDARMLGYSAERYLPPIRSAFLTGLIERLSKEED